MAKGFKNQLNSLNKIKKNIADDESLDLNAEKIIKIDIDTVITEKQVRKTRGFDDKSLNELAESISENGLQSPIIARPADRGQYTLVAGERRLRAMKLLGEKRIDAIVRNLTDRQSAEIQLIENVQREDNSALELSNYITELKKVFDCTVSDLARRIGKPRDWVSLAVNSHIPEAFECLVEQSTDMRLLKELSAVIEQDPTLAEQVLNKYRDPAVTLTRSALVAEKKAAYEELSEPNAPVATPPVPDSKPSPTVKEKQNRPVHVTSSRYEVIEVKLNKKKASLLLDQTVKVIIDDKIEEISLAHFFNT